MAYANTGLHLTGGALSGGPRVWLYTSADAHTDVDAAGYFSDGADFGLTANDAIIVVDTNTPTCTIHHVLNATSITAATLS